jgi:hypothetical protein
VWPNLLDILNQQLHPWVEAVKKLRPRRVPQAACQLVLEMNRLMDSEFRKTGHRFADAFQFHSCRSAYLERHGLTSSPWFPAMNRHGKKSPRKARSPHKNRSGLLGRVLYERGGTPTSVTCCPFISGQRSKPGVTALPLCTPSTYTLARFLVKFHNHFGGVKFWHPPFDNNHRWIIWKQLNLLPFYCSPNLTGHQISRSLSLNFKIHGLKIAVISSVLSSKPEHTVIGIRYALGIIHLVAISPNHFFRCAIMQDFHRPLQHNALEESLIKKIDASFRVIEILPNSYGRCIRRKEDMLDAFSFPWREHCL